jgi:tetratricopeptide (TPR) repeat protein
VTEPFCNKLLAGSNMPIKTSHVKKKIKLSLPAFGDEEAMEVDESIPPKQVDAAKVQQLISQGVASAEQGVYGYALSCWDQALQEDPLNSKAHEMRAQVLNEMGRTYDAIQAATRATELAPDWAAAHCTLARAQLNLGEVNLALNSFETAHKLAPADAEIAEELPRIRMMAVTHSREAQAGTRLQVK